MVAGAGIAIAATGARAQSGTLVVTLAGDAASQATPAHVTVTTADKDDRLVRADSGTREIKLGTIPAGHYRIETRIIGFTPDTSYVEIKADRDASVTVRLDRIAALDPVTVAGTNKGHLGAFEARRAAGKGTFLVKETLAKSRRVSDALSSVRGLRVTCVQGACRVLMVRSTNCEPEYFINGFPSNSEILMTPVLDIAGIEIYRGPSETPPEYLGVKSMCGAIGIWMK
jgi:hypothetical protein